MSTIFIAEKPSIAEAIARNLGSSFQKQQSKATPVYSFDFNGPCLATSVAGHLLSINFVAEYQQWSTDEEKLFQRDHIIYELSKGAGPIIGQIKSLLKSCKRLILALDADREGENICFEILRNIDFNKNNVFRLRFSALTREEITRQMKVLCKPDELLSNAVEVRQELDLKIGIAFSRFQTRFFQDKYADLNTKTVSYGPCQTPTLNFCVERHDQILGFRPQKYYEIDCCLRQPTSADTMKLLLNKFSTFNQEEAVQKIKKIKGVKLQVDDQKLSKVKVTRPGGMNTVRLLKMASEKLHISPNDALHRAESLYLQGYLTYPRTESTSYPQHFQFAEVIRACSDLDQLAVACKMIKTPNPKKGIDAGDHPPITPTSRSPADLSGLDQSFYLLVAKNFLASIMQDAEVAITDSIIKGEDIEFKVRSKDFIDMGWRVLYERNDEFEDDDKQEEEIKEIGDQLKKGQNFVIDDALLVDRVTRPPSYLTESQLLTQMEKHQIGTDASMATHIQNIIDRGYVALNTAGRGRCLIPTQLGIQLINGYRLIDKELVSPQLRSGMEADMSRVAEGKILKNEILDVQLRKYLDKFKYFKQHINLMDQLFESKFLSVKEAGKPFMQCGSCFKFMRLITKIPQRLYCPTCDKMFELVQNGKIIEVQGQKCGYCGFGLLSSMISVKEKRTVFCPNCYTEGCEQQTKEIKDFEEILIKRRNVSCLSCLHRNCCASLVNNYIGECPGCFGMGIDNRIIGRESDTEEVVKEKPTDDIIITLDDDILITIDEPDKKTEHADRKHTIEHKLYLDNLTIPGQAIICCNTCQLVMTLPQGKVKILEAICEQCGSRQINIASKEGDVQGCVCSMDGVEIINSGHVHQSIRDQRRNQIQKNKGKGGKGRGKGKK